MNENEFKELASKIKSLDSKKKNVADYINNLSIQLGNVIKYNKYNIQTEKNLAILWKLCSFQVDTCFSLIQLYAKAKNFDRYDDSRLNLQFWQGQLLTFETIASGMDYPKIHLLLKEHKDSIDNVFSNLSIK